MKNNRRNFLKRSGFAGLGIIGSLNGIRNNPYLETFQQTHRQVFNMSGYAAPRLDVVRTGVIGLGNRGSGTVRRLAGIEGVEIKALCDLDPGKVRSAAESIKDLGHRPDSYSGNEIEWKKVCERPDIDLIAVVTPWEWHAPMNIFAMEHDKHVFTELPAALTIKECWQLVETSEKTRKHCIQMSDSCHGYGGMTMSPIILNMARKGYFGDIIHAEGAYIHDIMLTFFSDKYYNLWRLKANIDRNGNLYPQHGLVPVLQMMDINYGDKMEYLVSVSSNDFILNDTARELAAKDDKWKPYVGKNYRGNINTTIIRTNKGRTIMVQHDTSSPRPDVRFNIITGTKGIFQAPDKIASSREGWLPEKEFKSLSETYMPEMVKKFNQLLKEAVKLETHKGGYFKTTPLDWRIIDCLRNGIPPDMDVYEAAASSSIIPLSIASVANESGSVKVPDYTAGAWKTNKRGMDIDLQRGGGTTRLL